MTRGPAARSGWAARWRRVWFEPGGPEGLAVCRTLLCGYLLWFNFDVGGNAVASPFLRELWEPVSFFMLLSSHIPSPEQLTAVAWAWKLALLSACLGLFTRSSLGAVFLLGIYVVGWRQNYGKVVHAQNAALIVTGVLALARCGDVWSLDAWRRRRAGRPPPPAKSSEYTWPIRCAWLVLALQFFGAGVSKLRAGGLEWIFSESFSRMLVYQQYHKPRVSELALALAQWSGLSQLLAFTSVAAELLAPLAVVSARARALLVPALLGMQIGIAVLMGTHVRSPNFVCYAFWVPWDRLFDRLRKRRGRDGRDQGA